MKHRFYITLILTLFVIDLSSQVSLRVFNYRPTGREYGFTFKSTFSAELGFTLPFDEDHWVRVGASVTYLKMSPRLDTFPVYATVSGGSGPSVLAGKQTFEKYNILKAFAGMDVALVNKEKIKAFIGTDIIAGATSVAYTYKINTLLDEGYSGGGYVIGLRGRLGAEYHINEDFVAFITVNRSYFIFSEPRAGGSNNDYGVGIRYIFIHD